MSEKWYNIDESSGWGWGRQEWETWEKKEETGMLEIGTGHVAIQNPEIKGLGAIMLTTWTQATHIIRKLSAGADPTSWGWVSNTAQYPRKDGYHYVVITKHDYYHFDLAEKNEWGTVSP